MLRYSTVAVAQRTPRTRKWVWTGAAIAATAGVAALTASGPIDQHEQGASSHDQLQQPISALDRLQQQLQTAASLIWPSHSTPTDSPQPSITTAALNRARATSARWLAQWAVDPDAREALLAFGSNKLLDFLIDTATDDPSPEQVHAEQALCNFLQGYHTSTRLLARPGAISRLLEHIAAGKASDALVERLTALATNRGADLSEGLSQEDGKELISMLSGGHGQQVQGLALKFLTAWSSAGGPPQCRQLSQSGLAAALGQLAMEAVTQGDQGRQLQKAVCRCQRALLAEPSAVPDEQLATWMQPLLFMAADAAASAAAAAAASGGKYPYGGLGSSVDGSSSSGGVLGLPGSAADLAVADVAMTTLGAVVAAGGPQVKAALADLHVMPTLDCLALSQDPAIRARAAAALAALVTAGNLEVEEASGRWTDMLLSWLISSTATVLQKREVSSGSSSSGWLLSGLFGSSSSSRDGGDVTGSAASGGQGDVGDEALARSCVAALRALSQQPGPVGLSVAQQWLARILLQLSSRVAAYTSITTLAPANGSSSGGSSRRGDVPAAALKAAGAVALADSATTGMVANPLIKDAAAAIRESSSSSSSSSSEHSSSLESPAAVAAVADTQSEAAGSSNSSSWWWWLGGRWWYGSPIDTSSSSTNPDDASSTSPNDLWAQLEAAKEAAWRDAAPVTPASAKAAADDLKAASNAMLSSWKGNAALALPSDLVPGMFVPAVEEAYPAAARVVDYAVAQQQTIHVMEILASVVAEDPTKQSWLLAAGILPLMERLVLHEDAALQPDAFVSKYSGSGSGGSSRGKGDKQQQSASDSTEVGSSSSRWWWSWWGASNSSSSSGDSANAQPTQYSSTNFVQRQPYVGVFPGAAIAPNAQIEHSTVQQQHAFDNDNRTDFDSNHNLHSSREDAATQQEHAGSSSQYSSSNNSSSNAAKRDEVIDAADHSSSSSSSSGNCRDQSSRKRMQKLHCEFGIEVDDVGDGDDVIGSPKDTAAAAAGSIGSWVADGIMSKFTAAAWSTSSSSSSSDVGRSKSAAAAAAPAGAVDDEDDTKVVADQNNNSSTQHVHEAAEVEAAAAVQEKQSSTTPAAAAAAKSYTPHYIPSTIHMEFAQGTASWDYVTSDVSYSLNPSSSHSSRNPNKALDTATALTAAAEEAPSLSDGDGLGFLCLQRQVARILSMLALQPVAASQLAESALGFSNGAVGVLQDLESKLGFKRKRDNKGPSDLSPRSSAVPNPGKRPVQRTGSSSNGSSSGQWLPWLLAAAASDDCLLASYATIGLLHLESAVAHQLHQQQQQQQSVTHHSSSSTSWQQRLAQELQAAEEDIAALIEELWPFSSTAASSSSSSNQGVWRPPVYYPDGIHLLNPNSSHHWGLLQPPRATLLESLGAAAANAAATAAAAAASDLAQSEIEGIPVPRVPDAADVASAAAAAATAAANALGADVSQLGQLQHGSSNENASGGSSSSSESACDLGLLQPAVVWLARKLVHLAAVKEEQIHEHQQQQQQQKGLSSSSSDPSAPLSTYAALQALVSKMNNDSSSVATAKLTSEKQQKQQQQHELAVVNSSSSRNMTAAAMHPPQPPDVDIIFIHGIRGGPFVTWRRGGLYKHAPSSSSSSARTVGRIADPAAASDEDGSSSSGVPLSPTAAAAAHRNHMTKGDCWPAAWLAADLPNARILSVEYKAPVTGWEGESLSLPDSGRLLLEKLVAAGVGQRPVVFVAHSMGGLIVKEMLSQSLEEPPTSRKGRLAAATRAVAFYSTPHFGSGMAALGWKLRHLPGASPAPSIHHLSPGPHLSALNARLALLHESGRVQVLSFTEGLATNLAGLGFLPKIVIVPYESAYPGFGEVCVLADKDHIDVCKPESREKLAYSKLLEFVRASGAVEDAVDKGSSSSSSSTEQQAACRGC